MSYRQSVLSFLYEKQTFPSKGKDDEQGKTDVESNDDGNADVSDAESTRDNEDDKVLQIA